MVSEILRPASKLDGGRVAPAREIAAFDTELLDGQSRFRLVYPNRFAAADPGKRHQINVVAFLERDPLAVGRWRYLIGKGELQMNSLIRAVHPHRDQVR